MKKRYKLLHRRNRLVPTHHKKWEWHVYDTKEGTILWSEPSKEGAKAFLHEAENKWIAIQRKESLKIVHSKPYSFFDIYMLRYKRENKEKAARLKKAREEKTKQTIRYLGKR